MYCLWLHKRPTHFVCFFILDIKPLSPLCVFHFLRLYFCNSAIRTMAVLPTCSCVAVTPDYLWKNQLQAIVLYPLALPELFWSRNLCLSPWPNTTSSAKLKRFLNIGLAGRKPEQLFVSQGVFTPSLATILTNLTSDLERSCAQRCNRTVLKWLQEDGGQRPNIVIVDFLLSSQDTMDIVDLLIGCNYTV